MEFLTTEQVEFYREYGYLALPGHLPSELIKQANDEIDRLSAHACEITASDELIDLEDTHSLDDPRIRRIKRPDLQSEFFDGLMRSDLILGPARELIGPDIRMHTTKLNMKKAGYGAEVKWHQDFAFYPHTNDDVLAIGIVFDDMGLENGPLQVFPGTHKGPMLDHHVDGVFAGSIDFAEAGLKITDAVSLTGPAGTVTIHHARIVHGSANNSSNRDRKMLFYEMMAADAYPVMGSMTRFDSIEAYNRLMLCGSSTLEPRLAPVPIRIPQPQPELNRSIYEIQAGRRAKTMTKPSIGFIGLGLMGWAMCQRLLDLGYPLTVIANRSRARVEEAVARGASEAASTRELAEASDIVMLCVDTSASVEARMKGDDGIIAGLKPGAIVIDFGTSLPASTRELGALVKAAGGILLDAPLGRTPSHALEGKLNIMCAGDEAAFKKVEGVLNDLGENVFHLGELGSGHTIKLINNFFGMTVANAMAEAFAMADAAGIDRQATYDVIAAGPLHSGMMDFVKAYAIEGNPNMLAFAIKNAFKDVGYYRTMAEQAGVDSIMSKSAYEALEAASAGGYGECMVSEMVDFFVQHFGDKKQGN